MLQLLLLLLLQPALSEILYGLLSSSASGATQLQTIDPVSGSRSLIGEPAAGTVQAGQALGVLITERKEFLFVASLNSSSQPSLVGLSLTTGRVVTSLQLPFASAEGMALAWAAELGDSGLLLLTAQSSAAAGAAAAAVLVASVDLDSGNLTTLLSIPLAGGPAVKGSSSSALHIPGSSLLLFELQQSSSSGPTLVRVDLSNSSWKVAPQPASSFLQSMAYSSTDGNIYGLGSVQAGAGSSSSSSSSSSRALFSLDQDSLAVTQIGPAMSSFGAMLGSSLALSSNSTAFWLAEQQQDSSKSIFLVQTDVGGAGTVTVAAQPMCREADTSQCPFSLGMTALCSLVGKC
jgi:hypothetical protein